MKCISWRIGAGGHDAKQRALSPVIANLSAWGDRWRIASDSSRVIASPCACREDAHESWTQACRHVKAKLKLVCWELIHLSSYLIWQVLWAAVVAKVRVVIHITKPACVVKAIPNAVAARLARTWASAIVEDLVRWKGTAYLASLKGILLHAQPQLLSAWETLQRTQ